MFYHSSFSHCYFLLYSFFIHPSLIVIFYYILSSFILLSLLFSIIFFLHSSFSHCYFLLYSFFIHPSLIAIFYYILSSNCTKIQFLVRLEDGLFLLTFRYLWTYKSKANCNFVLEKERILEECEKGLELKLFE
jgi:hypothetical protein